MCSLSHMLRPATWQLRPATSMSENSHVLWQLPVTQYPLLASPQHPCCDPQTQFRISWKNYPAVIHNPCGSATRMLRPATRRAVFQILNRKLITIIKPFNYLQKTFLRYQTTEKQCLNHLIPLNHLNFVKIHFNQQFWLHMIKESKILMF